MLPRFVAEQTGTRDTGDLTRAQAVGLLDAVLDVTAGGLTPLAIERSAPVPVSLDLDDLRRLAEAAHVPDRAGWGWDMARCVEVYQSDDQVPVYFDPRQVLYLA